MFDLQIEQFVFSLSWYVFYVESPENIAYKNEYIAYNFQLSNNVLSCGCCKGYFKWKSSDALTYDEWIWVS